MVRGFESSPKIEQPPIVARVARARRHQETLLRAPSASSAKGLNPEPGVWGRYGELGSLNPLSGSMLHPEHKPPMEGTLFGPSMAVAGRSASFFQLLAPPQQAKVATTPTSQL